MYKGKTANVKSIPRLMIERVNDLEQIDFEDGIKG